MKQKRGMSYKIRKAKRGKEQGNQRKLTEKRRKTDSLIATEVS